MRAMRCSKCREEAQTQQSLMHCLAVLHVLVVAFIYRTTGKGKPIRFWNQPFQFKIRPVTAYPV
jgi:hypothetical protein